MAFETNDLPEMAARIARIAANAKSAADGIADDDPNDDQAAREELLNKARDMERVAGILTELHQRETGQKAE